MHKGHRDRLRKKFLINDLDSLEDHEILELALFYAIPRKNTNEIAIKNYLKYSIIKGGKPVEDCLEKEIQQVKDKTLLTYIFNNTYTNISINNIINKYNDNDNDVSYHDTYNDTIQTQEKFKKPTLEEVEEYCRERRNGIDAERFINFYESKGWYIGKNKMKNWKACVRTWEQKIDDNLPKWFDQNIEKQQMTKQEKKEMNRLLENF